MLQHKIGLGGIILMGASVCLSGSVFAAPLQILDFKTGQLNQTTQDQLCTQLKTYAKRGAMEKPNNSRPEFVGFIES